ncbi:7490_t:CDS:2 [Funneliformis mosseae]|uniref:7490_t:CDS:1 n=1 Tax=Funneliformis mosseae TaxID=27381 RepID=A0A9N8WH49_FUNMO|nr:7490_t:CDS:2 [Funneliformis mosseae]
MPEITITVKSSNDQKYNVKIDTSKTVLEFKQAIAEKCDTAADRQRLIYSGKVLKDVDTLETYKIADGHTVHMVRGSTPAAADGSTPAAKPQRDTTTQTPQATPTPVPSTNNTPPNLFGGLGGFPSNTYGGGNVDTLHSLLNNPTTMQYMSQMLQDPRFVDNVIAMNPQFASMAPQLRQMMQDPEFQALMSNPEALRNMAALSSYMGGAPGPFTGGSGLSGFGGLGGLGGLGQPIGNNPATTTQPSTTDTTNRTTTTTGGTTPGSTAPNTSTPAINPFSFLNPAFAAGNPNSTQPSMPAGFDQSFLWGLNPPSTPQQPPEERFQTQLQQLNEMGFWDAQKNIRALLACGGNVNAAIEMLLSVDD